MTDAGRHVPLHRPPRRAQRHRRHQHGLRRHHLIGIAMGQENRRPVGAGRWGRGQQPRQTHNRGRWHGPAQPQMQGQHRALTEAHQNELLRRKLEALQFYIQKLVQGGAGAFHAAMHFGGIDPGNGKPLKAGRTGNRIGGMRGNEMGARHHLLPMRRQPDQVVAVRAIAMHQHHQMGRRTAQRRKAGTGKRT